MKNLKYLLIIILFHSCNGQESKGTVTYPKSKEMSTEHFNVNGFKNYQTEQEKVSSLNATEKVTIEGNATIKEYSLISSENGIEYARETLPSTPNLFYSLKIFDEKGNIKNSIDKVFFGILAFEYGVHNFYDQKGYLTKQIDYNDQFNSVKVKLEDLLNFLAREEIRIDNIDLQTKEELQSRWFQSNKDFNTQNVLDKIEEIFAETKEERGEFEKKFINAYNRQDIERIYISFDFKKKIWIIKKDFSSLGKIIMHVDATNNKIIESKYEL